MTNVCHHHKWVIIGFGFIISVLAIASYYQTVNIHVSLHVRVDHIEGNLSVEELLSDFVVVTGISSNHYGEAQDMIGSVHYFLPNTPIIIYDLGLDSKHVQALNELKNVQIRQYDFEAIGRTDYRKLGYRKGLGCYAWKIFIIDEISKEHKIFVWFDASIRLLKPITTNDCIRSVNDIPLTACFGHKRIIQFTDEGTVKYLNTSRQQMKGVIGLEANCLLFKMSRKMRFVMGTNG